MNAKVADLESDPPLLGTNPVARVSITDKGRLVHSRRASSRQEGHGRELLLKTIRCFGMFTPFPRTTERRRVTVKSWCIDSLPLKPLRRTVRGQESEDDE